MKQRTREKPESVALGRSDCWECQHELCPSAGIITNGVRLVNDSKDRSEKGDTANAISLTEI